MNNFSEEYESELLAILESHDIISCNYDILAYIPAYSYEVDSIIDDKVTAETFDVFKVYDNVRNCEAYLSYSDYDNYRISSFNTVRGYANKCRLSNKKISRKIV